jgi:hypothetical protein
MAEIRSRWIAILAVGIATLGGSDGDVHLPAQGEAVLPEARTSYRIVDEETLFAVVTLRAGLAGRLAHDHLVRPVRYDAELSFDPAAPERSRFSLEFAAEDLVADDREWKDRVQDRLQELGILDGRLHSVSEDQARDIREAMLGRGQLDAARHPRIRLRSLGIERDGEDPFPFLIGVEMTLREEVALAAVRGRIDERPDGTLQVEAHGAFRFTDFGIKPYSAFLGSVRVRDRFYLYTRMVLAPEEG